MITSSILSLWARKALRPKGREAFLDSLPLGARVLDVGCGNNSPTKSKVQRPDLYYVGVDIGDYNQDTAVLSNANEYVITTPEDFAASISRLGRRFDAVISAHNIEHCDDQTGTLKAMASVLAPGGRLFLAWPSETSANFPSRAGTLNFFDDPSHKAMPVYNDVLAVLQRSGLTPVFQAREYRPLLSLIIGLVLEPIAIIRRTTMPFRSTWALYGFESVIWFGQAST